MKKSLLLINLLLGSSFCLGSDNQSKNYQITEKHYWRTTSNYDGTGYTIYGVKDTDTDYFEQGFCVVRAQELGIVGSSSFLPFPGIEPTYKIKYFTSEQAKRLDEQSKCRAIEESTTWFMSRCKDLDQAILAMIRLYHQKKVDT